jgi:carboxylesterase type B
MIHDAIRFLEMKSEFIETPDSSKKLPVLVFVHGGGFTTGSSSLGAYDPSILVVRGNLIFVSMQYR